MELCSVRSVLYIRTVSGPKGRQIFLQGPYEFDVACRVSQDLYIRNPGTS